MERLRFAWWNTRLVHKDGAKQQEIACEVVRRLIDEAGVVLLALGEVTETQAEMLRDACHTRPLSLLADDSVPRKMALCYRRDILDLHSYERLTTGWRNKELQRILHAELIGLPLPLHVFVNHWPSNYMNDSSQAERSRLAQDLRAKLRDMPTLSQVVILGDFNVEPFDAAICEELEASRSRDAVTKGRALLYNPFWRLLGERQSLGEALLQPRKSAGTYLYRSSNATSQWYTMDQILVSAPLLNPEKWHLLEEETFIWQEPPLLVEKTGCPRHEFDHFPIVGTLRSPV
jgi:endonuclease/exonuclease/phosphatase family metal-dependent hydrolase